MSHRPPVSPTTFLENARANRKPHENKPENLSVLSRRFGNFAGLARFGGTSIGDIGMISLDAHTLVGSRPLNRFFIAIDWE
jgi:hypothetical protein